MSRASLNIESFKKRIIENAPSFKAFMRNAARTKFDASKEEILEDIDSHEVTTEIEEGAYAESNDSDTMEGKPNLFAFIGFDAGTDPIADLKEMIEKTVNMSDNPTISYTGTSVIFHFPVTLPSQADLVSAAPLPFNKSKSWVTSVEKGLWGLSHYLFGPHMDPERDTIKGSRSGPAIEVEGVTSSREFTPTPYLSEILLNFKEKLKPA